MNNPNSAKVLGADQGLLFCLKGVTILMKHKIITGGESMEIKRKDDGTIEGMTPRGDFVKEEFTDEEKKRQEMKKK